MTTTANTAFDNPASAAVTTPNNDENYYPECKRCGSCCHVAILCISPEELRLMRDYIEEHDVVAIDYGPDRCPLQDRDNRCMVYPVRPQPCRIHNCTRSAIETMKIYPDLVIHEDEPFIDMRAAFLHGDFSDLRKRVWD